MAAARESFRITVSVVSRSPRILTWLLLVLLIGGHWGMLQVVAWTGMLVDYSQDNSFIEAVEMTFGGEYRCSLCKQVDAGVAADLGAGERKAPGKTCKTVKLDALVAMMTVPLPAPARRVLPPAPDPLALTGTEVEPLRRPPQTLG